MRFQKGEFFKSWDFQFVNFWIKCGFLPQYYVRTGNLIFLLLLKKAIFSMRDFLLFYRRLGDEMRSMSLEKSRQREAELAQEIERLQMEIKTLQKNSEEAANVNQQLSKEVRGKKCNIAQYLTPLFCRSKMSRTKLVKERRKWKNSFKK